MREPAAALRAFRLVAEHASFTRAAAVLDVTPSALSQTLLQLEEHLDVRLLQRSTRRVGLTEAGRQLLERIAAPLSEIDAALEQTASKAAARRSSDGHLAACRRRRLRRADPAGVFPALP